MASRAPPLPAIGPQLGSGIRVSVIDRVEVINRDLLRLTNFDQFRMVKEEFQMSQSPSDQFDIAARGAVGGATGALKSANDRRALMGLAMSITCSVAMLMIIISSSRKKDGTGAIGPRQAWGFCLGMIIIGLNICAMTWLAFWGRGTMWKVGGSLIGLAVCGFGIIGAIWGV